MSKDFHYNKRVCDEVALISSKRLRNKIAGYATILMNRIERGPVRGISLKLQEEEREKKMEYIPQQSEFVMKNVILDDETKNMLRSLNLERTFTSK